MVVAGLLPFDHLPSGDPVLLSCILFFFSFSFVFSFGMECKEEKEKEYCRAISS